MKQSEPADLLQFMKKAQSSSHVECRKSMYFAALAGMAWMLGIWQAWSYYMQLPMGYPWWKCCVSFGIAIGLWIVSWKRLPY